METLIKRHPIAFFSTTAVMALLLATCFVFLSDGLAHGLPWLTGVPCSTLISPSAVSLGYLRRAFLLAHHSVLA